MEQKLLIQIHCLINKEGAINSLDFLLGKLQSYDKSENQKFIKVNKILETILLDI